MMRGCYRTDQGSYRTDQGIGPIGIPYGIPILFSFLEALYEEEAQKKIHFLHSTR